jgi:broad-specificity NMP kinase
MTRVLLTGMSGTGKSTILRELDARGYTTVDTDFDDWCVWTEDERGEPEQVWDEERIHALLTDTREINLFISGTVSNQGKFYPLFDHVVLLSAPTPVIVERLATRTHNPYGKHPDELAEILGYIETVEPLLRRTASQEIDTSAPLEDVLETILNLVRD